MNSAGIGRFVASAAEFVRTAWLIAGVTLILLLLMEGCVRVRSTLTDPRRSWPIGLEPGDPRIAMPWYAEFTKDFDATRVMIWKSYVYFGRRSTYRGRYVNIDSLGRRITPQPTMPVVPVARVFFFGGSTMWGNAQRDSSTIAAVAARRLQTLAGAGERIEVTNFAENGYVMTQGIIQLMLQLRAGNRPDVVVFYDGINDAGATVIWGAAGVPQNEAKRVADFAMGRALDRTGFERGLSRDVRALRIVAGEALKQSELFQWILSLKQSPPGPFISADSGARATVRVYVENIRLVEALATRYGFTPVYVWQPTVQATEKPHTPYEQRLIRMIRNDPFQNRLREVQIAIPRMLDSAIHTVATGRFVNANSVLNGNTSHIFVDRVGHTTEEANPIIVEAFWPQLAAAIGHRRAAPGIGADRNGPFERTRGRR